MWKSVILDVECIVCNKSLQKINHLPRHNNCNKMGKIIKVNNNRRLRTPNWSPEEKQFLLELIKQRKDVVVTKNNNGPNYYEEKDIAWNEILSQLVTRFGNKFTGITIKKVKTQWQNMKRIAREEAALNGPVLQNYSRLSLEVCNVIDYRTDGEVLTENENLNGTTLTTNVEIKAEYIEEECGPSSYSAVSMETEAQNQASSSNVATNQLESSSSSVSDQVSEANVCENPDKENNVKCNASVMTDGSTDDVNNILNPFNRELQQYFQYTAAEKQLKLDSLKEERHIVRAMRETAELNKIIAEQKLKHVLWVKKQEMMMYAGEPGSGAGKGGGGGGSIREAGGAFGKMEAGREEEYFYRKQKEQIENLKGHLDKEISFHQEQIKRHEDAIRRHKEQRSVIDKK